MANIVVVGPHPDDQELGMGGTAALLASQGHRVWFVDVTNGEPTPFGDPATRAREGEAAASILSRGAPHPIVRVSLGLPNRRVEATIETRHRMAGVYRACRADVVFLPHPDDAHPDHRAVTRLGEDARFDAKLTGQAMPSAWAGASDDPIYPRWVFYYFATHLRAVPAPAFLVDVGVFGERKIEAIGAYRSQFESNPGNRGVIDRVRASLAYFGSRAGGMGGSVASAEPFAGPEPLALTGLGAVVGVRDG